MKPLSMFAVGIALVATLSAQAPKLEYPQASPASTVKQRVGLTDIEYTYSRPGVKGRTIFGETGSLEQYGKVWRTGANAATKITFSTPVTFGGTKVPAGSYALFSIPGADEWTVILNTVTGQWGAYAYDAKNDVVRVKATPVRLTEPVETFTIDINDIRDDSATLNLVWQNVRVPVKLTFDVVGAILPQINASMRSMAGAYDRAAMFYFEHGQDLNKAAEWIDIALRQQPDAFYLHYHKAQILAKTGDKVGAIEAARRSMELASKQDGSAKDEYLRLNQKLIDSLGK